MGDRTSIEWTDASWPIVNGCDKVSAGCRGCYALKLIATRLRHTPKYAGLAKMTGSGPVWTGEVRLWPKHLDWPLRWRAPRKVFVADMGDLFHKDVPDEWIDRVFAVMALAPQHTFQVLTKRPERMRAWFERTESGAQREQLVAEQMDQRLDLPRGRTFPRHPAAWPLPNVWLGVSVEDQATADARIPLLLQTPAAVRFVSYEPALGPVDFGRYVHLAGQPSESDGGRCSNCGIDAARAPSCIDEGDGEWTCSSRCDEQLDEMGCPLEPPHLDWIIVGGESGPGARPFDAAWARSTIAQCRAAGVACFVKQLGASPVWYSETDPTWNRRGAAGEAIELHDRKGGDPAEWPEDLRVREMPEARR